MWITLYKTLMLKSPDASQYSNKMRKDQAKKSPPLTGSRQMILPSGLEGGGLPAMAPHLAGRCDHLFRAEPAADLCTFVLYLPAIFCKFR